MQALFYYNSRWLFIRFGLFLSLLAEAPTGVVRRSGRDEPRQPYRNEERKDAVLSDL